ncbi:amidoligase family protein [Paenibacillus macquariensis]|uniref:Amidoligase enzyme n=1 Tax=Paenibacillus macquariensis TaxID=948756 RepID=A0ABY1KEL2_9BACL|nr:amidoligase family protein [Paenibacillus macquariensis]OAB28408.1 hypothetical protein PMSM_24440 [Paenibacillus macquariensis subsp. macquariensis]SIR71590.1 Putative amidoligase enzyme [Paenibacillus macquariensis]
MTQRFIVCRICNRKLTNPRSIAVSMGPVCVRRFGVLFDEALQYANSLGRQLDVGLIENAAVISAQDAYRNRLRGRSNQVPQNQTIEVMSGTLGQMEEVNVEFCNENHAQVITPRGSYDVTENSCTCPHYVHRLQNTGQECRHIEAFRRARGQESNRSSTPLRVAIDNEARIQARRSFEFIDWREQEARESVLEVWKQNRGFDGILMTEDTGAFDEILQQATGEWEYKYENVLGGTGNTFGMEIEFELPSGVTGREVAAALHQAEILDSPTISGYHSNGGTPGFWKLETDGSLQNGLELVSPILFDRRETWEQIEKATEVLKGIGVKVNQRTGGHIHVGIAPMDHKTYAWQRLARIGLGYEKLFYRMGSADPEAYNNGSHGRHRGRRYATALSAESRRIRGTDTAVMARKKLSENRYSLFNATNVDAIRNCKPTLEMRYPNSSLDASQWQAQIQVANAIVHQASVIENNSPLSRFTPGLSDLEHQLRVTNRSTEVTEREYFRKFLDVLGNKEDRLAASWLFLRGRA